MGSGLGSGMGVGVGLISGAGVGVAGSTTTESSPLVASLVALPAASVAVAVTEYVLPWVSALKVPLLGVAVPRFRLQLPDAGITV